MRYSRADWARKFTSMSRGDCREALGSLWYHEHKHDFTGQNIYARLFGPRRFSSDTGRQLRFFGSRDALTRRDKR